MREMLIDCCALDWSRISPAIFGALFQSVMKPELRRNLGAHYTTEKNILKVIGPLFLDELRAEFEKQRPAEKACEFHQQLAKLKFLDPACGCGNFLVIAYRELRLLELEILRVLARQAQTASLDVSQFEHSVRRGPVLRHRDRGIPGPDRPSRALAHGPPDEHAGVRGIRPIISCACRSRNPQPSLRQRSATDWSEIVQPKELSYILGNPPFGGKTIPERRTESGYGYCLRQTFKAQACLIM